MSRGDLRALQRSVHQALIKLCQKAGYEVIIPKNLAKLCCGQLFNTRGFTSAGAFKTDQVAPLSLGAQMSSLLQTMPP
jgi:D-lactate dehydrogenase